MYFIEASGYMFLQLLSFFQLFLQIVTRYARIDHSALFQDFCIRMNSDYVVLIPAGIELSKYPVTQSTTTALKGNIETTKVLSSFSNTSFTFVDVIRTDSLDLWTEEEKLEVWNPKLFL